MVFALSCFKHLLLLLLLLPNPDCVVAVAISEVFMGRVRINTCKNNLFSPLKHQPSSRTRRRNQLHATQDQSSLSHQQQQQAWKALILLPLLLFWRSWLVHLIQVRVKKNCDLGWWDASRRWSLACLDIVFVPEQRIFLEFELLLLLLLSDALRYHRGESSCKNSGSSGSSRESIADLTHSGSGSRSRSTRPVRHRSILQRPRNPGRRCCCCCCCWCENAGSLAWSTRSSIQLRRRKRGRFFRQAPDHRLLALPWSGGGSALHTPFRSTHQSSNGTLAIKRLWTKQALLHSSYRHHSRWWR